MTLSLQVVGREGLVLRETGIDRIVVRRREAKHDPGSEVAICPRHGLLLMQTQACRMRLTSGREVRHVDVGAGVLEVLDDSVTLVLS